MKRQTTRPITNCSRSLGMYYKLESCANIFTGRSHTHIYPLLRTQIEILERCMCVPVSLKDPLCSIYLDVSWLFTRSTEYGSEFAYIILIYLSVLIE